MLYYIAPTPETAWPQIGRYMIPPAILDAALPAVALFATNVNTKLLQQASKTKPAETEESSV